MRLSPREVFVKYIIYLAVAALVVWAVVYLTRHVRRQLRGDCGSCGGCGGGGSCCGKKKK